MTKEFNITGTCFPDEHYMVDITGKLQQIMALVERGKYFTINRPRQFGKTTTLLQLAELLEESEHYSVFRMSFEGIGDSIFENEKGFSESFVRLTERSFNNSSPQILAWIRNQIQKTGSLLALSDFITELTEQTPKKVVLLIDEVDKSSNNQLFVSFLGLLRDKYLERKEKKTFHSVVLTGVHDVKTLKLRLRPDSERKLNSPWNIATDFRVDMSFNPAEIKTMLDAYIAETHVVMDTNQFAELLYYYTSGYPFLVSKLCKMMDEDFLPKKSEKTWTVDDLELAVQKLVRESNTNFDSLTQNLESYPDLQNLVRKIVVEGETLPFNIHLPDVNLGVLFGFFASEGTLKIHNRIYNEVIYNYLSEKMMLQIRQPDSAFLNNFRLPENRLDFPLVLEKFQTFMREQYSHQDRDFLERNGRLVFLAFLKPIINGAGYEFKESQISDERRLDVVVTFFQHKYVVELKLWRGEEYHRRGMKQLADYLDRLGLNDGFLVIFDHKERKSWKKQWLDAHGKRLFAVWV